MTHRFLPGAISRFLNDCDGPTSVEYALIVGLTVVAILGAAGGLWEVISYLWRAVEQPLQDATT